MITKLSEICDFLSGNAWKAASFQDSGMPIIRINNMNFNDNDFVYWQDVYDKKYLINKGDLLLSLSGTIKTFKWNGPEALLNQRIVKITAKQHLNVNIDWIYYQLHYAIEIIANKGKHAVIRNVSINDLKEFEVDIPEIQIQNKIVSILNKANSLLTKKGESIVLLNSLLRATFLEMFGDPRLNPNNFPIRKLSEFYIDKKNGTKCGPFGSALKKDEYTEVGVPVWTMDNISKDGKFHPKPNLNISEDKFKELSSYAILNNDVIISRAGTVGKMCVVKTEFPNSIISTNLIRVRFNDDLLPTYFVALMLYCKGGIGRLQKGGDGAFTHMSTGILDSLEFPYPKVELQKSFELKQTRFHEIITKLKISFNEIDNLFNSLTQKIFNGQLNFNVDFELDALIREIDLQKKENDLSKISGDISYLQRLIDKLNNQEFKEKDLYDKAKHGTFQLMSVKEEERKVFQEYDENSKSLKLALK
jgi:type I restriction enzyme S subunit